MHDFLTAPKYLEICEQQVIFTSATVTS